MMKSFSIALMLLGAAGCGPSNDKDDDIVIVANNGATTNNAPTNSNSTGSNNTSATTEENAALVNGITAPRDAKDAADGALSLTVEAAVLASVAANGGEQLVTTGTLTQNGDQFTYAAGPSDRLVVKWTEGPQTELTIQQLDGNFEVESIDAFFGENHVVDVGLKRDGIADFRAASGKSGGTREAGIIGSITDDGVTYELNLTEVGTTTSDIGTTVDYESETTMSGTIKAPGLELIAEESYYFHSVYVDNLIVNRSRTANSRWTYNGEEYAVQDLFIRTATANSYPDEFDYWRVEGAVTQNGAVVGQVTTEEDQFAIRIIVLLNDGTKLQLDEYIKYQE